MDREGADTLGKPSAIPPKLNWASLLRHDSEELEAH